MTGDSLQHKNHHPPQRVILSLSEFERLRICGSALHSLLRKCSELESGARRAGSLSRGQSAKFVEFSRKKHRGLMAELFRCPAKSRQEVVAVVDGQ